MHGIMHSGLYASFIVGLIFERYNTNVHPPLTQPQNDDMFVKETKCVVVLTFSFIEFAESLPSVVNTEYATTGCYK